ncbi:hypothetical protein ACRAWG_01305 [Methylobacterium sp. P31]
MLGLLERVPADRPVGPLILDETAGRSNAESAYGREWQIVARAAGVPDHVWNMDARAGAVTEAEDAGADLDHIRSAAARTQVSTTQRYSRGAVGKSRGMAESQARPSSREEWGLNSPWGMRWGTWGTRDQR